MKSIQMDSKLQLTSNLEELYGSSFYIFDVDQLRANYIKMNAAFRKRYSSFVIGYSYKTNYVPAVLHEMAELGAYAEVVSKLEYELALKIGKDPTEIIYNGPLKNYEDISFALQNGSILNVDSFYEIELIEKYAKRNRVRRFEVGVRVNMEVQVDGQSVVQDGFTRSRFGFSVENGQFERAIKQLKSIGNVDVVGLHGHCSTNKRSVEIYEQITRNLCVLAKKYLSSTLQYIDIGGGFYGDVPRTMQTRSIPTVDDYAEVICSVMNEYKKDFTNEPVLIIEPGISLVVNTFTFYCKVIDVKEIGNLSYVLVAGSVHNMNPAMHSKKMPMEHIKKSVTNRKGFFHIVGNTCMEKDYLVEHEEGDIPQRGDYIAFTHVGAYTIVLNPPFIHERPPIIAQKGNEFAVARRKENLHHFIDEDLYVFTTESTCL